MPSYFACQMSGALKRRSVDRFTPRHAGKKATSFVTAHSLSLLTSEQTVEETTIADDQRLKYDENLMELFVAGRHYRLFVMITTQYAKAITPTLRGNTDYCFMMKTIQQRQLEALWEDFGSFLTKDAFAAVINAYTDFLSGGSAKN